MMANQQCNSSPVIWLRTLKSMKALFLCCVFVSVQCVAALDEFGCDENVITYPRGEINVMYGNPLVIYCSSKNFSSRELNFTYGGKHLDSEILNDTTIVLRIEKPMIQDSIIYCTNKVKHNCVNKVVVDTPPQNVTDFKCISHNLESLNCSWSSTQTHIRIDYNLTFYVNNVSLKPCDIQRIDNTRYCIWNTRTTPRYRQQMTEYKFNLTGSNVFGSNEQFFNIDHFSVLKPEAPINLTVLRKTAHSVLLQWSISNNLYDLLPSNVGLDHKIEYQIAKIDNLKIFRSVNVAGRLPPLNKTYRFELAELPYAYFHYEVRVYIKSRKADAEEFWSDFSYVVFRTGSEIPQRPPEIPAGAFNFIEYTSHRELRVYWQQLQEYEESGANFTYLILVSQGNKVETVFPHKNESLSYVVLPRVTMDSLDVSVRSMNSEGSSINSSHLYVPPKSNILVGPNSFTKLAYANGTYELSWDINQYNIDNYTLFWCRYNVSQKCVGRMNFTMLNKLQNTHVIDLPNDQRYQFAISVNRGFQTSGMVWAKCDISKDANYDISVDLTYDSPEGSSVVVRWKMDCTLRDGSISGYNITYCPVINTTEICNETLGKQSVFIPEVKNIGSKNITNLLYHTTYKFVFMLIKTNGAIAPRSASVVVTTGEGLPSSPENVSVSNITYNSVVLSYNPPEKKNGNIVKYVIYNFGEVFATDTDHLPNNSDNSRRYTLLTNLKGFTNYSWSVQACNKHCSILKPDEAILMRTSMGPPGITKLKTRDRDQLEWLPPNDTAGYIDYYVVERVNDEKGSENITTTETFLSGLPPCQGDIYRVRAVTVDEDPHHGAMGYSDNVVLPIRVKGHDRDVYYGEWSDFARAVCISNKSNVPMYLLYMALLAILIGVCYGFIQLYKKYRIMKDIKPVLPDGLTVPDKDVIKYPGLGWNPANKDEKPAPSDELLLLPVKPHMETKQKQESAPNDHTDSTGTSETSHGHLEERGASTSDEGSNDSSLEPEARNERGSSLYSSTSSVGVSSPDKSLLFNTVGSMNLIERKPIINPATGYVQSAEPPFKSCMPSHTLPQPTTSSYVFAGLDPPITSNAFKPQKRFFVNPKTGYAQAVGDTYTPTSEGTVKPTSAYVLANLDSIITANVDAPRPVRHVPQSSGYVRQEDLNDGCFTNFSKHDLPSPKPDCLPTMPSLSSILKHEPNIASILAQEKSALHDLPNKKMGGTEPCVEDTLIAKHLNILSNGNQNIDDPAILDPTEMSPDAYCRFSWNVDPSQDNLNSLH